MTKPQACQSCITKRETTWSDLVAALSAASQKPSSENEAARVAARLEFERAEDYEIMCKAGNCVRVPCARCQANVFLTTRRALEKLRALTFAAGLDDEPRRKTEAFEASRLEVQARENAYLCAAGCCKVAKP